MFAGVFLLGLLALGADNAAPPADAIAANLLRRPEYEYVAISPTGTYLAVAHHVGDGTTVEIQRRADGAMVTRFVPTSRGEVGWMAWLGPEKLMVSASRSVGPYPAPLAKPWLFLVTVGDKYAKQLPQNVVAMIDGDDDHVMVRSCRSGRLDPCYPEVRRVSIDHVSGQGDFISDAPSPNSELTYDHAGRPRFAMDMADDAGERFYVKAGDNWKLLNNSDESGVFVNAIAISRDNTQAYLLRENKQGTNSIQRYDFANGTQTEVLRDALSDPLSTIYSIDGREPIGAVFGPGRPRERYWGEEVRWRQAVSAAFPDASTTVLNATRDGELAIIKVSSDTDPGAFYLFDRQHAKADLLFRSSPWLDLKQQLPTQPISFSARDGLPLTGFITMPHVAHGEQPAMVVMVHGGPFYTRAEWQFDPVVQLLAQHGYAVLQVNFRGSAGAGRSFVDAGRHQWGAAMQDDITDGTLWAIHQDMADAHRVCIFGISYGAYSAMMGAVREPALYRCAVGLSGVYDLNRIYRWGDTHRSDFGTSYLRLMIGSDPAALARVSPTSLAAQIKIPVLLGHGADDARAPVQHATALRDALRDAGNPTELFIYNYEGHGLVGYDDSVDFYTRTLRFLDVHTAVQTSPKGP